MTVKSDAPFPSESAALVAEAASWATAVREALAASVKEEFFCALDFISRYLHLSTLNDLLLGDSDGNVTFDPSGNVAVPANTSSQRLASGGEPVREPGERWFEPMPDCPCTWGAIDFKRTVNDKKGRPGRWIPSTGGTLKDYHPGAAKEIRWAPTGGGAGQQCTYDKRNKLITRGLAAGTPDFYGPNNQAVGHLGEDVVPFLNCNLFELFDVPPISCDIYMKLYPPNQGNGCADNVAGPMPSSVLTCWAQTH